MSPEAARTQKEQMLETIANLKGSIERTGLRIRDLEKSLKGSRAEVAGLKRVIDNLKRTVAEKDALVQRLTARVDSLTAAVSGLQTEVRQGQEVIGEQKQVIETKRREIGTIRYIIGTKDDLKKKGIVVEKGGFIGLGKSVLLSAEFAGGDFTALDTDQATEIPIAGKEPRVLSPQTKSSYEIQPAGPDQSTLRILDAAEFRKVRYLVIMVK